MTYLQEFQMVFVLFVRIFENLVIKEIKCKDFKNV